MPVDRNSENYIKNIAIDELQSDFGHPGFAGFPYVVVSSSQHYVPLHFKYVGESDPGPYPIPLNASVEQRSDRHVIVVDSATCKLYEMDGLRLRLKASVNISSYPPQARVILMALKEYGMFLADKGDSSKLALSGAPGSFWNDDELATLSKIRGSDFEVVDESALQASTDSAQTYSSCDASPWRL